MVYPRSMLNRFQFVTRLLAATAVVAGILSLILVSPLFLREITHVKGVDWQRLSDAGQTYGAASALLSGIALIGVAATLLVQTRQDKVERIRIVRERHVELARMTASDPQVYGPIVGVNVKSQADADNYRAHVMVTLWMNYARMGYQMDVLSERSLRGELFAEMFQSEVTRDWWKSVREHWLNNPVPERRARRFSKMINEEYLKAIASGPPTVFANRRAGRSKKVYVHWKDVLGIGSGIAIGAILGSGLGRNRQSLSYVPVVLQEVRRHQRRPAGGGSPRRACMPVMSWSQAAGVRPVRARCAQAVAPGPEHVRDGRLKIDAR